MTYRHTRTGWVSVADGGIQHGIGIEHVHAADVPDVDRHSYQASTALMRHGPRSIFSSAASRRVMRENILL